MTADTGKALGFDDEVTQENEFQILPDGDYEFTVTSYDRTQFNGSEKMCACPEVDVVITINYKDREGNAATRDMTHKLFLNSKIEGRISEFFEGIGMKEKGKPFRMAWQQTVGKTGKLKLGHREYNDQTYNDIKKFYEKKCDGPAWKAGF